MMGRIRFHMGLTLRGFKIFLNYPKPLLLSAAVSSLTSSAVPFINIYFSARILNELAGNRDQSRLVSLVLLTIGLNLVSMLIKALLERWSEHCSAQIWLYVSKVYSDKLMSMDFIDIENPEIQQQVSTIRQHQHGMGFGFPRLWHSFSPIIKGLIQIILSVALAFSMFSMRIPEGSALSFLDSPISVFIVLMLLCLIVFVAPYLTMHGGKIWAKTSEDNNRYNRLFSFYFYEMISGSNRAKDIRIYDQKRLIWGFVENWPIWKWIEKSRYYAKFSTLSTAITYLANGLIYLFVALKAFAGAFGVGSIVQYVGAITQFSSGFNLLFNYIGDLINNNTFLENTFALLDIPNKKYQGTLSIEKRDDNEYQIEFRNVSFRYPGSNTYALRHLNLKLNIGRRMAVVGMNGSGKTTMIKLLCRLYDPTEGIITLNGIDIKKYNYDEYMGIFSVVFQDFKLLPFTLGQNVAARVDYDQSMVLQTLDKSGFTPRLDTMDLDTYLYKDFEENGIEVSGGEAQKIALARALYKNAPFIVLDEPTAALDPIAEYEIYSKFNDIVGDKTAIYISHRLSSCRFCDDIAVFHEGELIQRGSHEQLVTDENGKYFELWNAQAQYYNDKSA